MFIDSYPVLPLRDLVVFPGMIVPLFVGRDKSLKALEASAKIGNKIVLVAQKEANADDPSVGDLYKVGVICNILQVLKLQDNTLKVLVEGKQRVKISKYEHEGNFFQAFVKSMPDEGGDSKDNDVTALRRSIMELFEQYVQLNTKINPDVVASLIGIDDISKFSDSISSHILLRVKKSKMYWKLFIR
jgi:ATP-dependent Lon protease